MTDYRTTRETASDEDAFKAFVALVDSLSENEMVKVVVEIDNER